MKEQAVVITGIGLLTSLGEGVEQHWDALDNSMVKPRLDTTTFAPYVVHALGEVDWNKQITKRSDQRQMETWQRLGTYAAGLALDDAGIKGDLSLTSTMDMIVAAGGGERDVAVDSQILAKGREKNDREVMLNHMLSTELRPTLFLAQLSNLLAGNISIVHKVTGSSRTFMGEEGSGLSAIKIAADRIRSGQSTHSLVGGSYNAQHYDMLLGQELGSLLKRDGYAPVWERQGTQGGGLITGTGGVFLVLESKDHAQSRGAQCYAEIQDLVVGQINRSVKPLDQTMETMFGRIKADKEFVVSGASGVHQPTLSEKQFLEKAGMNYRAIGSLFGHLREAQFPLAIALAAISVHNGKAFAAHSGDENNCEDVIERAIVTTIGANRSEGLARLVAG